MSLIDSDKSPFFSMGRTELNPNAKTLIGIVAGAIRDLPNKLILQGHTDSHAYPIESKVTNWSLSANRADAARKELLKAGIIGHRISKLEGLADTQPFFIEDKFDPSNRRISIILSD